MSDETPQEPPVPPQEPAAPEVSAAWPPATPPTTGSGSSPKRTLALVTAVLVVLGVGGSAFAFMKLRGSSDLLMRQVPAEADIVATVYLDPAASQKVNLFRMTGRFPLLGSESDLTQQLDTMLDQAGRPVGLDHNDFDWIGSQAAVVVDLAGASPPNYEILIGVDNVAAARAALEKGLAGVGTSGTVWHTTSYKGVDVTFSSADAAAYAFVGDTLVIGNTTTGIDSIIDTDQGGASLADAPEFQATSEGLPEGRLAFAYVNVKTLLPLAEQALSQAEQASGTTAGGLDVSAFRAIRGVGMTISARSDGLGLDVYEALDPSLLTDAQKAAIAEPHDNPLTSFVPPGAFGLAQAENVDAMLEAAISQLQTASPAAASQLEEAGITGPDGLLAALSGDLTVEVGPGTSGLPVSGALILGIDDPAKFDAAVSKLKDFVAAQSCPRGSGVLVVVGSPGSGSCPLPEWRTETYKGTTINFVSPGDGTSIAYATMDGVGAIGAGPDSIEALIDAGAGANITSNAAFTAAQGAVPSRSSFFYVDLRAILETVASNSSDPGAPQVVSTLHPIEAIAIGQESASDHTLVRFVILIP